MTLTVHRSPITPSKIRDFLTKTLPFPAILRRNNVIDFT